MKVFGIGLSRTGTASLAGALHALGYPSVHCPRTLQQIALYDAATDTPIALGFEFLDIMYPGSKFIYTTRNLDAWLSSCQRFWLNLKSDDFIHKVHTSLYGMAEGFHWGAFTIACHRHEARIDKYFAYRPRDVLRLNICGGEGWDKLCPFLGRPVPDVPFPRLNTGKS